METVPHGTVGELLIRTDCMTVGYLDDPEATDKAFIDGWLRTGDLARMDDREYITILGRNQDSYKRSGATVYTIDAENVLVSHPAVQTAAVIGVADVGVGQVGIAYVELVAGASATGDELIAHCAGRLAATRFLPKSLWSTNCHELLQARCGRTNSRTPTRRPSRAPDPSR